MNTVEEFTTKDLNLFGVPPLIIEDHYDIDYRHSYAQDSPFFVGLSKGGFTRITMFGMWLYVRHTSIALHGMRSTDQMEKLPLTGHIHTFTVCYYGGERFLKETPFILILVEFKDVNTLFLSRLKGMDSEQVHIGLPIRPRFAKTPTFKVTDVWFEPIVKN